MALENEVTRVAGGAKDALKSLIKKLGGTVGDELIDKYSGLADKVTKPDKWDKGVLLDGGALKDVNGNDIHADVKTALDIPAANDAKLTIQKNGAEVGTFSANASADKTINITVPTKASDIGAATATDLQSTQAAVDTLSGKVGTVPAGKTVVEMIDDAQTAATYNDTAIKDDIKKNADAIGVLNGSGAGSVDKKITDAFNDFATKVSDDGVVNSYKELIDWAATHGAEAATMAGEITTLKNILKGIGGAGESATVVAYVTSAISALKIGDYAKAADLTALAKRVTAAEGSISTLTGDEKTAGSVKKALADAKAYADDLAPNYDKAGDATKALTDAKSYTDAQIKAIPTPDVSGQISTHNQDTAAHADIREAVSKAGKPFIIEGTLAEDGTTISVDKTRAEVKTAVQAGESVTLHFGLDGTYVDLALTQFRFADSVDSYYFSAIGEEVYVASLQYIGTGTRYNAEFRVVLFPTLSNAAPSAPGTASAGKSYEAARADHVHPKEVSDDDRSTWNGKASKPKACLVTLKSSGWDADSKTQIATVASVVADEAAQMIHPMPRIGQITTYNDAGIQLIAQGAGNVTFMCDTIPEADVDVWVVTEDVEDVTPPPPPTASVTPQSGVDYTAGLSGLEASDMTAFAQAISNCSDVTNEATVVYVDHGDVHRKISVGDQVTLPLNGTNYAFDVIGFNHDALTTPTAYGTATVTGKAGITFQMHDLFGTNFAMNDVNSNTGGWKSSKMRTSTMVTMKGYLPSAWQTAIKSVNKLSGVGDGASSGTEVVSDDCFLLAEGEIFGPGYGDGGSGYSFDDECAKVTQYAYYKAGNSKVKNQNGSAKSWWVRSPLSGNSDSFCIVLNFGSAINNPAGNTLGVAFGFCV